MRTLIGLVFALSALPALAQNSLDFSVDLSDPLNPVATWTVSPAADSCEATGSWTGAKSATGGTETLSAIRQSSIWAIECQWAGDTIATLTWVNPTQNDDGTPYTNPGVTRLAWTSGSNLSAFDCLQPNAVPSISFVDRPAGQTMHTITGLGPVGTWSFAAYAVNTLGLCSLASNVATKSFSGPASLSDSMSVKVPGAPSVGVE